MARPLKALKLREKAGYSVADVYGPDGSRATVNFGPVPKHSGDAAAICELFACRLKLFESSPHQCLSFDSLSEAVTKMSPSSDFETVGVLISLILASRSPPSTSLAEAISVRTTSVSVRPSNQAVEPHTRAVHALRRASGRATQTSSNPPF